MKKTVLYSTIVAVALSSSAINADALETKNWDYFCKLSDSEVFDQYQAYRNDTGNPIRESYTVNGIEYFNFIEDAEISLSYGHLMSNSFEVSIPSLGNKEQPETDMTDANGILPEYYGFSSSPACSCDLSIISNGIGLIHISDNRFETNDVYDIMRRELTLYNSRFYVDYGEGSTISWNYLEDELKLLPGDANGDAKVDLCDAVAVLQYVALPEKYPISESALSAADCDGVPGITGGDALWIQQQDAGLI